MSYCRNCGKEIIVGASFCGACGTPVQIENLYQNAMTAGMVNAAPLVKQKSVVPKNHLQIAGIIGYIISFVMLIISIFLPNSKSGFSIMRIAEISERFASEMLIDIGLIFIGTLLFSVVLMLSDTITKISYRKSPFIIVLSILSYIIFMASVFFVVIGLIKFLVAYSDFSAPYGTGYAMVILSSFLALVSFIIYVIGIETIKNNENS